VGLMCLCCTPIPCPLLAAQSVVLQPFLRAPAADVGPILMLHSLDLPFDRVAKATYTCNFYKCMFYDHCVSGPECICSDKELR
jgi:hypothetical protein